MRSESDSRFPLADLTVVDFSQVLAGPYAGRLFADLGANVIKIESPAGDLSRRIAPRRDRGMSGLYTWANAGKRNVCIDLAQDEGRNLALALVAKADIVLENFRPGVADRLGIGWEAVHAVNPRAVMVSISGFGATSSLKNRGAFAPSIHAATGLLEYQARKTEQPIRPLADARADITTALHAMVAVLAALRVAQRTGQGEYIELAMYDAVLAAYPETPFELLDPPEPRYDTPPFNAGPNGWLVVAGPLQHIWAEARRAFHLEDPAPPGADVPTKARLRHEAIERWMAQQPGREALIHTLEAAKLPCAPVETLREALTGPFARERQLLVEVDDRRGGKRRVVRSPYRFRHLVSAVQGPPPRRGEHNAEVLREQLGMEDEQIRGLQAAGVLQVAAAEDE